MISRSSRPHNSAAASSSSPLVPPTLGVGPSPNSTSNQSSNVSQLLAKREISPRTGRCPKRFLGKASGLDPRQALRSWVEAESLLHLSANYCPLQPPPRSTIAAAFSPDGKALASTHGDHTVKIVDYQTGKCLKVLSGHRRTPWVVRFHPLNPEVLASGSLDHEVRLWDAKSAECVASRDFYRPIASIAFHAQGDILAVASGHKLYIWHYNKRGEASSPTIVLKTRRSLRAVHFHPHALPFLLTAEVNDLDSSDPSAAVLASSPSYLRYPLPTIYLSDAHTGYGPNLRNELPVISTPLSPWPSISRDERNLPSQQTVRGIRSDAFQQRVDSSASTRLFTHTALSGQYEHAFSPVESPMQEEPENNPVAREAGSQLSVDPMETDFPEERSAFPFGGSANWDVPFLQGWLIGQSQTGGRATHSQNGGAIEGLSSYGAMRNPSLVSPAVAPNLVDRSRTSGRYGPQQRSSASQIISDIGSTHGVAFNRIPPERSNSQPFIRQVQSEVATSMAAAAVAELPCTVKLRVWHHDVKFPCASLDTGWCRLTIPHAVLCSEMGAHFSPCGRFLAVCVACILPSMDSDIGFQSQFQHDAVGAPTSPTRHPISAHKVMYELRIYTLEEATFGTILSSRAIRAANCLTSIQFSPTSEHLLLAYGRRHSSLLKSVVIDGDTTVPIYTILEIYRVSDMELVRVLPSANDEVNVACFHPSVGGGLVYGTKEGKLRILRCDISHGFTNEGPCVSDDNNRFEVPAFAMEG